MSTLVERLRSILSSEDDDFFKDEVIVDYLNKSQERVVNYLVTTELNSRRTYRALDTLRVTGNAVISGSPSSFLTFYTRDVSCPADMRQLGTVMYNNTIPLRELPMSKINQLNNGNAKPSAVEGYYFNLSVGGSKKIRVYVHDSSAINPYTFYYYANPVAVTASSTSLTSLPSQLENAVIYGAAELMLLQESVKDPNTSIQTIRTIYMDELQGGMF